MTSPAENLRINVLYFARLQEQSGRAGETCTVDAPCTAAQLYALLREKYCFDLPQERLRAAVNHSFCTWDTLLCDGDTAAFIPPVAGG